MLTDVAAPDGARVRVLLLARTAGAWLDQLGAAEPAVRDQIQAAKNAELALSPVIDTELSDAQIVAQAVEAFSLELKLPKKTVEIVGRGAGKHRILDLHAAALVGVLDGTQNQVVKVDIGDVLDELLGHETRYWYPTATASGLCQGPTGLSPSLIRQVVATVALLGAATEAEARALPTRVPGLAPSPKVAKWLRELYPPEESDSGWLSSLRPDRLAELHVVRELSGSAELAQACLTGLDARQGCQAVTLLARAVADDLEADELLNRTLPNVANFLTDLEAPRDTLIAIYNAIPHRTVILASAALALCQRIVGLLSDDSNAAVRAHWLSCLSTRFSELGRPADALPATEEAVTIYRELATADPNQYRPDLANSLSNLGVWHRDLGRTTDALLITAEAVTILGGLAAVDPNRYAPDLAASLSNLSAWLMELDRPVDAQQPIELALDIHRQLAVAYPDRYRPELASSLDNLGLCLKELGRPADALPLAEEGADIRRELAAADPDQHRPDLSASLSNLGLCFRALGRTADALPVTEEAVIIYRELAATNPGRYRSYLAASLSNLGSCLRKLGRPADAVPVTREAVNIYRELANPSQYRSFAASLSDLSLCFSTLRRLADALPATEEAATIYRELATADPNRYRPDLASSLDRLGIYLQTLGRMTDALPATEEAATIYRELATADPNRYRPDLASSLDRLGIWLQELDRTADALRVTKPRSTGQ